MGDHRGPWRTSRVIVVLCERIANVNSFAIVAVWPATPEEIKLWMEGTRWPFTKTPVQ